MSKLSWVTCGCQLLRIHGLWLSRRMNAKFVATYSELQCFTRGSLVLFGCTHSVALMIECETWDHVLGSRASVGFMLRQVGGTVH